MKLRTAAVTATDDSGNTIGGPYFLPLDADAKRELRGLMREHGPLDLGTKPKEQANEKHRQ